MKTLKDAVISSLELQFNNTLYCTTLNANSKWITNYQLMNHVIQKYVMEHQLIYHSLFRFIYIFTDFLLSLIEMWRQNCIINYPQGRQHCIYSHSDCSKGEFDTYFKSVSCLKIFVNRYCIWTKPYLKYSKYVTAMLFFQVWLGNCAIRSALQLYHMWCIKNVTLQTKGILSKNRKL